MIIIIMRKKKVDSFRLELKRKTTNDWNEWKDLKKKNPYTTDQSLSYFQTGPRRCNRLRLQGGKETAGRR